MNDNALLKNVNYWVAVKELSLSYYIGETLLFTVTTTQIIMVSLISHPINIFINIPEAP